MWQLLVIVSVIAATSSSPLDSDRTPVILTNDGLLQGERLSCGLFCNYYSFKGIPYAEPPVGDLRFRAPRPNRPWEGVRDATKHGNTCPSGAILGGPGGDEDCLFLNIYTRNLKEKRPVMVWIHGGSFSGGSGDSWIYGPDHIIDDGVLLVTINYRLGVLGFMSTGDSHAPGNYGLKDMVLALKWIQRNIAEFGGDPDNVTIFGESAGGAAVHYLVLSSETKGLFTRAISQSGSALNPWAFQTNPVNVAYQLGRDLRLSWSSNEDLVRQLREVDPADLVRATPGALSYPIPRGLRPIPFVPCQDPPNTFAEEKFLPRTPIEIMTDGEFNRVPYITGYTDAESLFMIRELLLDNNVFPTFNNNPELLIPFQWNVQPGSQEAQEIVNEIRNMYFNGTTLANDLRYEYTQYNTDLMFAHGIDLTARIHSSHQREPVYYYKFSFVGTLNVIKTMLFLNDYPGAVHADDIFYLFSVTRLPPPLLPTNDAISIRRRMVRMWTNFATNGNPTPLFDLIASTRWPRCQNNQEFLDIGTEVKSSTFPMEERMGFWNTMYNKYGRHN